MADVDECEAPEMKIECGGDGIVCSDELDHLPLTQRLKILISTKPEPPLSPPPGFEDGGNNGGGSVAKKLETPVLWTGVSREKDKQFDSQLLKSETDVKDDDFDNLDHIVLKERLMLLRSRNVKPTRAFLEESTVQLNPLDKLEDLVSSTNCESSSTLLPLGTSELDKETHGSGSTLLNLVQVKAEPFETCEVDKETHAVKGFTLDDLLVKKEYEIPEEPHEDNLDHMSLQDRIKLQKTWESEFDTTSQTFKPIRILRSRKRKKTATDSIETALDEDAPGLLQVLLENGVSPDEIKLYGETDNDEPIDDSFIEDSFSELEAVISKLFFQRDSFLKFATVHSTKVSKPSYCLGCLFSLVEQTRYLQFRNWPAEWGWCRDLQSFIFIFKNHKRIVLERPEYGYATYFFELVDTLPVDWQIKRLVTAMKLNNCGRISVIENKALLVGKDLSEGEAKVLMQYGWIPNSGLGTMLNYCDRVFHDRKNEKEISEWRSKIGKLLMDGYSGGTTVLTSIQTNAVECNSIESSEIKMELPEIKMEFN